jgi:hypothetical protein
MVPIFKRILPLGRTWGRPGYKLKGRRTITMHNTANEKRGADAETHARYLEDGHAISWHFTADHDSIVQHLPLDEQGWHTGTDAGNTTSIGIEVCEYNLADPNEAWKESKAEDNGAWLAAKLCYELGLDPKTDVVTHKSWSGKICPRDILPHWRAFLAVVQRHYDSMDGEDMVLNCKWVRVPGSAPNLATAKAIADGRGMWAKELTPGTLSIHARDEYAPALIRQLQGYAAFSGKMKVERTYEGSFNDIETA